MNYQLLGRSGFRVSDLCLGTMTFGEDWGWGSPKDTEMMKGLASVDEAGRRTVREVVTLAKEMGVTPAHVALAWLLHRSVLVIPIIGARTLAQLNDNLRSLETTFSPEQLHRLNDASAVPMGFPHDFLASDMVRTFTFGGMRERIKA